jgi:hypothetical protein
VIELTVDDYLTRFGETIDDLTLTGSANGDRFSRARALAQINMARRALLREFLQAGVAESRFSEKVEITADSSDADMFAIPSRMYRLIGIVNDDDREYNPVYSRHRIRDAGYLVEPRSIRWFNMSPPSETLYAVVIREPVSLSLGTAAAGAATTITLATAPTVGRNIVEDDHYNGCRIAALSGTGALQISTITDFVASTLVATSAWTTAPSTDTVYSLMEDMPRCVVDAVVLRAVVNTTRFDAEFEHVMPRLIGEMKAAKNSALSELMKPTSASADGPRTTTRWVV